MPFDRKNYVNQSLSLAVVNFQEIFLGWTARKIPRSRIFIPPFFSFFFPPKRIYEVFNSVVKPQLTSPSPLSLLTPLPQRLSNGSLESAHEASQVVELQDLLEKQNYELAQMKERMSSLSSRVSEVEQELETARKDLIKSEEMNNKYQRDIKEVTARTYLPKKKGNNSRRRERERDIKHGPK